MAELFRQDSRRFEDSLGDMIFAEGSDSIRHRATIEEETGPIDRTESVNSASRDPTHILIEDPGAPQHQKAKIFEALLRPVARGMSTHRCSRKGLMRRSQTGDEALGYRGRKPKILTYPPHASSSGGDNP